MFDFMHVSTGEVVSVDSEENPENVPVWSLPKIYPREQMELFLIYEMYNT